MSNARCYFRIDIQTVCGHTWRHGSHDRWRRGDRKHNNEQTPYSHPFTPRSWKCDAALNQHHFADTSAGQSCNCGATTYPQRCHEHPAHFAGECPHSYVYDTCDCPHEDAPETAA